MRANSRYESQSSQEEIIDLDEVSSQSQESFLPSIQVNNDVTPSNPVRLFSQTQSIQQINGSSTEDNDTNQQLYQSYQQSLEHHQEEEEERPFTRRRYFHQVNLRNSGSTYTEEQIQHQFHLRSQAILPTYRHVTARSNYYSRQMQGQSQDSNQSQQESNTESDSGEMYEDQSLQNVAKYSDQNGSIFVRYFDEDQLVNSIVGAHQWRAEILTYIQNNEKQVQQLSTYGPLAVLVQHRLAQVNYLEFKDTQLQCMVQGLNFDSFKLMMRLLTYFTYTPNIGQLGISKQKSKQYVYQHVIPSISSLHHCLKAHNERMTGATASELLILKVLIDIHAMQLGQEEGPPFKRYRKHLVPLAKYFYKRVLTDHDLRWIHRQLKYTSGSQSLCTEYLAEVKEFSSTCEYVAYFKQQARQLGNLEGRRSQFIL